MKNIDLSAPQKVCLTHDGGLLIFQKKDDTNTMLVLYVGSFENCNEFCKMGSLAISKIKEKLSEIERCCKGWESASNYEKALGNLEHAEKAKETFDIREKQRLHLSALLEKFDKNI